MGIIKKDYGLNNSFTHAQLMDAGFTHHKMVTEDEFKYEYWDCKILGCWFEVTNVYSLTGEFSSQEYMLNNNEVNITAEQFDGLFSQIYKFRQDFEVSLSLKGGRDTNDLETCIGCENKFNYEDMAQDDAGENYCPECWAHFKPILKADLEQAIREGGIDPLEENGFSFETGV